jgi:hypothetical protein
MLEPYAVVEVLLVGKVLELILVLHFVLDDLALFHVLEPKSIFGQVDFHDAGVMLQILTQDEEVLRVQARVDQNELSHRISLDLKQRHQHAVDGELLHLVLEHELGEVLQGELVHTGVLELDGARDDLLAKVFLREERMPDDLPQGDWGLSDVVL